MSMKNKNSKKPSSYSKKRRDYVSKDKKYFINIWRGIKDNRTYSLVQILGLICLITILYFYLYDNLNKYIFIASWLVVYFIMFLIVKHIKKRASATKAVQDKVSKVDPVSLGTLYFSFALSLWIEKPKINDPLILIIAILISLISLGFIIAVYNKRIRTFLIQKIAPYLIGLTFIAIVFGFIMGLLSAIMQASGIPLQIIVYFGFAWVVTLLLVMFRDIMTQVGSILFVLFFLFLAGIKFNASDLVGGIALFIIGFLVYLVATGHLHPYGEIFE